MSSVKFDNPASEELVHARLRSISDYLGSGNSNYCCFVYGMGKKYQSAYKKLGELPGVEIVWSKSTLPRVLRFLGRAIASHEGLVQIEDPSQLAIVFDALTDQGMAGIYCIRPKMASEFKSRAVSHAQDLSLTSLAEHDSYYFAYVVDADNDESSTGIYEVVSYGPNAPVGNLGFIVESAENIVR